MPPAEVAQRAAEAGLPLTLRGVNAIRNLAKANLAKKSKRGPGRPRIVKEPAANAAPPGTRRAVSKTAYVRGLPESMPAEEVVAKAAAEGIALSKNHVSTIRSLARTAAGKKVGKGPAKRGPGRPPKVVSNGAHEASVGGFEVQLAELVLDHGVRRVEEALAAIGARLQALL
jgi:hypothetical protein